MKFRVISDSVLTHAGQSHVAGDEIEADPNAGHVKLWQRFGQIEPAEGSKPKDEKPKKKPKQEPEKPKGEGEGDTDSTGGEKAEGEKPE